MTIGVPGNVQCEIEPMNLCRNAELSAGYSNLEMKGRSIMNNSYETPEVLDCGRAQSLIRGMKWPDPLYCDTEMGCGYRTIEADIYESEE
jgi:hypothetical protein